MKAQDEWRFKSENKTIRINFAIVKILSVNFSSYLQRYKFHGKFQLKNWSLWPKTVDKKMTAKIQVLVKTDQMKLSLIFIIINFSYLYQSSVIHHLNLQKRNNSTFVRQWTIQNTVLCGVCNPRGNNFMMSNGNDFYLLWGAREKISR